MPRKGLRSMIVVHDFNSAGHLTPGRADFPPPERARWSCVRRAVRVLASLGFSSTSRLQRLRGAIPRQLQVSWVLVPRSVSRHGFCPADVPREPPRHRDLPAGPRHQALPRGVPLQDFQEHYGGRESASRLADLRRLRAYPDSACPCAVRERCVGRGSGRDDLRPGLDHDRPLPEPLPVGQISTHESGGQAAHALGSPRQHSLFCARFARQNARCQRARPTIDRACRVLCDGSSVHRLPPPAAVHDGRRVLRDTDQEQSSVRSPGETFRRSHARQGSAAITRSCSMGSRRRPCIRSR